MSNSSNISSDDLLKILQEHPELHESLGMETGPRIVWDILFGGMLFVAVVGNLIVLWIVVGKMLTNFVGGWKFAHWIFSHQNIQPKIIRLNIHISLKGSETMENLIVRIS